MMDLELLGISVMAAAVVATSFLIVTSRDMVYASALLAVLGVINAILIGLLGFPIISIVIVIVYVGAAVMFMIIVISMLGGGGEEELRPLRGVMVATPVTALLGAVVAYSRLEDLYSKPGPVELSDVSSALLGDYLPVLIVLIVAMAATLVEAIAVAKGR